MLFLGDKGHYYGRFPWVSLCLVVVNVTVFVAQVELGDPLTNAYSMVPEEITTGKDLKGTKTLWVKIPEQDQNGDPTGHVTDKAVEIKHYAGPSPIYLTLLSSVFLHGSFLHLFFNMWCLLIFSRNVECAMGHGLFLAFYLTCGLCANLAQLYSEPHSIVPVLGASGAIAGVMGAYLSIYPLNMIKVWFIFLFDLPAAVVLLLWLTLQYLSAMLDPHQAEGVAYWAHLGGFCAGFIMLRTLVLVLRRVAGRRAGRRNAAPAARETPEADPYAGFATMQTVRRMQEKKNREQGS